MTQNVVLNAVTGELELAHTEIEQHFILDAITGEFVVQMEEPNLLPKNIVKPLKNRKNRRSKQSNTWQKNVRKNARLQGNSFIDPQGNVRPLKEMGSPCSNCRLKCYERLTDQLRETFFDKFYQLGSARLKWEFILNYTRTIGTKKFNENSRRQYSRQFFIGTGVHTHGSEEMEKVCKTMFLSTLAISDSMIRKAHDKILNKDGILHDNLRGGHVRKVSDLRREQRNMVHEHINSFPKVDSHYSRENCVKQFLDSELSVAKMYSMYVQYIPDPTFMVTERLYRDIFNTDFNLSFHTLKKDACDKCIQYQYASPQRKIELQATYQSHLVRKDRARSIKNQFIEEGKKTSEKLCAIFDYEKGITLPRAEASSFYYKRKLTVHNFTIYDTTSKVAFNFVYDESLTGSGPNEVCSSLFKFIESNHKLGVRQFYFISDNCPGQNHNMFLFGFYAFCSAFFNIDIEHLFLVRGHTQSEVDGVHSVIERSLKKKTLFAPVQLYDIIQTCSKKRLYKIVKLTLDDILNFKVRIS